MAHQPQLESPPQSLLRIPLAQPRGCCLHPRSRFRTARCGTPIARTVRSHRIRSLSRDYPDPWRPLWRYQLERRNLDTASVETEMVAIPCAEYRAVLSLEAAMSPRFPRVCIISQLHPEVIVAGRNQNFGQLCRRSQHNYRAHSPMTVCHLIDVFHVFSSPLLGMSRIPVILLDPTSPCGRGPTVSFVVRGSDASLALHT